MPPRPAKGRAAQSFVSARGVPDSLQSFLGDVSCSWTRSGEDAAMMEVNLKLLQKSNETTVLKALAELERQVGVVEEGALEFYLPGIVEAVMRHAEHGNALVRAGVFSLLHGTVQRGMAMKDALALRLPSLAPTWVTCMHDMESSVRRNASDAFHAVFGPEALHEHAERIVECLIGSFEEVVERSRGKPLQDDNLDRRSNALYSFVCAMGYMVRQSVPARRKIVDFIDRDSLRPIMPLKAGASKGSLVAKTPLVRSASLVLLRDVVESRIATPQVQQCISSALYDAMFDDEVVVVRRAWELLLLWCGENPAKAAEYFQEGFMSAVTKSFIRCNELEVAEVIYPSLVPLLVPLTRDLQRVDIISEFGDALVSKLESLGEVGVQEWHLVLSALMQLWELMCVRAVGCGESHENDGVMLFCRIIKTLIFSMQEATRSARYMKTTVSIIAQSMTRAVRHSGDTLHRCVQALCGHPNTDLNMFVSLGNAAPSANFTMLQAALVGATLSLPAVSSEAERLLEKYADAKLWEPLVTLMKAGSKKSIDSETSISGAAAAFVPARALQSRVAKGLMEAVQCSAVLTAGEEREMKNEEPPVSVLQELFSLVLSWNDTETRDQLQKFSTQIGSRLRWVEECICTYDLSHPERLLGLFLQACRSADFVMVERCVEVLNGGQEQRRVLSDTERDQLRRGVQESLEAILRFVSDDGEEDMVRDSQNGLEVGCGESDDIHSSNNDNSSNDDGGSATSGAEEGGGSSDATVDESDYDDDDETANKGTLAMRQIIGWADLLRKGGSFVSLLGVTGDDLALPVLFRIVAAIAPRLHTEQYMSIKALRVALHEERDPLLQAMGRKKHSIGVSQFNLLVEHVEQLLDSHDISVEQRDTVSLELFDEVIRKPCCGLAACSQLSRLVPFASNTLLRGIACSKEMWVDHQVRVLEGKGFDTENLPFAMLDGYCSLDAMELTLLSCVRTAQLVHLLGVSVPIETCDAVSVALPLLSAARLQEVLADPIRKLLMTKLLPSLLLRISSEDVIMALVTGHSEPHILLCTLACVIRDIAGHSCSNVFLANARKIVSVVTQWIVDSLLLGKGMAPVHAAAVAAYRAFFASLDKAADVVGDSILSNIATRQAAAVQEAMCMLPELKPHTALLTITLHRHLEHAPVVAASTVRQIIEHTHNQRPIEGVEFLAELASCRIMDTSAYNDLVHTITHLLARCCRLRHMPPNGRLVQQAPNDIPMAAKDLRQVVVASASARRGVILHGRNDDVLRSSVNLILFDAVTECVVTLRQTREEDVPLVAKLIGFTSSCLSDLVSSDVSVLRASEASVMKVASVMTYAYQWLCATSIAKLDSIGMNTVASAICAVALLSNLTLMHSDFVLFPIMRQITTKRSIKNLRTEFSVRSPAKIKLFTQHAAIIAKTKKQKLALFPHLLAWCVALSGSVQESITKERREEVFHLLDTLCSLLLASTERGGKHMEATFLYSTARVGDEQFSLDTAALTRADAPDLMELVKGAASVFALLLQANTLSTVKSWLDTIERQLQDHFYAFVGRCVSPLLIRESLAALLSKSPSGNHTFDISENYAITVSLAKSCITLKYTMEDACVTAQIAFPSAYPLHPPTVTYESGRECGVSTEKWRAWMLKMAALLFGGSANVWDCVTLFGRNMDAHFAGREPCPICFAVVSAAGHRLPNMCCAVCRNSAIHSDCLYAWWANSGQTVCPLCRSPWVSS